MSFASPPPASLPFLLIRMSLCNFKMVSFSHASTKCFVSIYVLPPFLRRQIETHVDGERVRYFQDDDNVGLKEMVRREKMSSAQDQNALYSRMAAKVRTPHCNLPTARTAKHNIRSVSWHIFVTLCHNLCISTAFLACLVASRFPLCFHECIAWLPAALLSPVAQ